MATDVLTGPPVSSASAERAPAAPRQPDQPQRQEPTGQVGDRAPLPDARGYYLARQGRTDDPQKRLAQVAGDMDAAKTPALVNMAPDTGSVSMISTAEDPTHLAEHARAGITGEPVAETGTSPEATAAQPAAAETGKKSGLLSAEEVVAAALGNEPPAKSNEASATASVPPPSTEQRAEHSEAMREAIGFEGLSAQQQRLIEPIIDDIADHFTTAKWTEIQARLGKRGEISGRSQKDMLRVFRRIPGGVKLALNGKANEEQMKIAIRNEQANLLTANEAEIAEIKKRFPMSLIFLKIIGWVAALTGITILNAGQSNFDDILRSV